MKFSRIFKETKLIWASKINIADGTLSETGDYFPQLSSEWDLAQERVTSLNEFNDLMVWAIFCGLHKLAIETLKAGGTEIYIKNINRGYVEFKFSESLKNYEKRLRNSYINDIEL
ncbi:hypothetical protein [Pseudoalteromonas ostreae]|uniref:hypothetical protein n=1 Tax=Pseudoalteromonas ostreae TaxID=2774154 RepID=UPI001B36C78A|nr:hypothetical protein [Pseudoalteromonas ostreae]